MNTRFRPLLVAAALTVPAAWPLAAPAVTGCAQGAAPPPAPAAAATAQPPRTVRGGVAYDSSKPLEATLTPRFDVKAPPKQALTYALAYRGGEGAPVTALYTVPASASETAKVPCIVLLHGLGGKKEDVFLPAVALNAKGYATLAIDIAGHGARPRYNGKPVGELTLPEVRTVAGQTVADLRRAVDFLATRKEVDLGRVGFVGVSLGGILGAVFVGDEPRIRAAVLWASGGDWGKLITTSKHQFAKKYQQPGGPSVAEVDAALSDVEPLKNVASIAPRPLLFINGDKDEVVPTVCTDELFAAAREPKKRVVLPGGHIPDIPTMMGQTTAWLDEHVKGK